LLSGRKLEPTGELPVVRQSYLRIAGLVAAAGVLCVFLAVYGLALAWVYLSPSLPEVASLRNVDMQVPLRVYTRSGALIAQIGEQRRIPVAYDQIPEIVKQAFLSAEDDHFFEHHGIDFLGTLRAGLVDMIERNKAQGASTITQQAARNVFLSLDKTWRRKFQEFFVTYKMEDEFSKQEIFNLYLNVIFFGQRAYGVAAAAETFFGKPLDQLTVAEAATIAGMPKAPSKFNPIINPQAAIQRRTYVLRRLRERNIIDDATAEAANREPMNARTHALPYDIEAPYVAEMARQFVRQHMPNGDRAESSGYKVFTTIDGRLQEAANRAVRLGLIEYDRRHGYRGPLSHADVSPTTKPEQLESIVSEYATVGNLAPAIVVGTGPKNAKVYVHLRGEAQIDWDGLSWARRAGAKADAPPGPAPKSAADVVKRGDVVYVVADSSGHAQLAQVPQVQSALVSLDPHDGAVAALVGGFDYFANKYNRAVQARRQPGSGFKPFLYSSALENGFTVASTEQDSPLPVSEGPGVEDSWRPEDDTHHFGAPMRLREALVASVNLVSIRLLKELTTSYVIDYAKRFGFDPKRNAMPSNDLTLALGTLSATPMDMVTAYATFANGGFKIEPYFIDRIEDGNGNVVWSASPKIACEACESEHAATLKDLPPKRPGGGAEFLRNADTIRGPDIPAAQLAPRVISPRNDYVMTDLMADVIKRGTGRRALALGRGDIAGKTGTTNGPDRSTKDTWFNGFTPRIVATVWMGYDQERNMGASEQGATTSLPIWIHYMREALKGTPDVRRPMPDGLVTLRISPTTGTLVSAENPDGIQELFFNDHLPTAAEASTGTPASEGGQQNGEQQIF
jgi:penicillin-binding protein 1A